MCIGLPKTPDVPQVPQRQPSLSPDGGDTGVRADEQTKRRMGMAASILTTPTGTLGSPVTTNSGAKTMLGA